MKTTRLGVCLALALAAPLGAQEAQLAAAPAADLPHPLLNDEQLDQLLGPIALYPDALIALILPAATEPVDLVLASRYLKDGGDPVAAESHAWDESVKSLAHYPDVLKWMDDNLPWTKQLGEAFRAQSADVMKSIQRLRARARANGALADTPQQIVVSEDDYVRIVPTRPDVLYVPQYEPAIVFVDRPVYYGTPFLTFGVGYRVGSWLTNDCNWRARQIWVADHRWNWRDQHDWRHPVFPGQPGYVNQPSRHPWKPLETAPRPPTITQRTWRGDNATFAAPVVQAGAPQPAHDYRGRGTRTDSRVTPVPLNATTVASGALYATTPAPTPAPQPATPVRAPRDSSRDNGGDRGDWRARNSPSSPPTISMATPPPAATHVGPVWHQAPAPATQPISMPAPAPTFTAPVHTPPVVAPAPAPAPQPPPSQSRDDSKNKQAN